MKFKKTLSIITVFIMCTSTAFAHQGRTDKYGGHHDYQNSSGLGIYHYHCGGYPPHLHNNDICPYASQTTPSAPKYVYKSIVKSIDTENSALYNYIKKMIYLSIFPNTK